MLARSLALLAALAAVAHTPSSTRANTTIIVEPCTTATTVTVDEHAAGGASAFCAAAAATLTPTYANGKLGFLMYITLNDAAACRATEIKLHSLNAMHGR